MTRTSAACIVAALAAWMPVEAAAQEIASSLEELVRNRGLRAGDGVYVTDDSGQRIKGDVSDLTGTTLEVRTRNGNRSLRADAIRRIERRDSLENGILLGLAAGLAVCYVSCHRESRDGEFCYGTAHYFFPVFLPITAGSVVAGAMLDASVNRTVYAAPGSTRLTWSPAVSNRHLGVRASVSW